METFIRSVVNDALKEFSIKNGEFWAVKDCMPYSSCEECGHETIEVEIRLVYSNTDSLFFEMVETCLLKDAHIIFSIEVHKDTSAKFLHDMMAKIRDDLNKAVRAKG